MMMKKTYTEEIDRVTQSLRMFRNEHTRVFLLFSDLHTAGVDTETAQQLLTALEQLCKAVRPDGVIDLGDNLSMLGRERHITNEQLVTTLTQLFDRMSQVASCPLFLINGNHDAVGTDFFKPALFNRIVAGKYDSGRAQRSPNGSWFFVEDPEARLRMVFLSVPYESDVEAEHPRPLWEFGAEQLRWLEEEALATEYDVLLFTHVPFFYRYRGDMTQMLAVWNGEKVAQAYISQLCGWIDDAPRAAEMLNASGKVRACFSGHTHTDSVWMPFEKRGEDVHPLSCPQIVTRKAVAFHPAPEDVGVSIDVLLWDYEQKQIRLIRFGDGADRVL